MKTFYSILVLVLFSGSVYGGTKKADRLFERWEYYRAAQLYEREAKRDPDADVYFRLGECYRKMNRYKQAEYAYDKVNEYGTYHNPEFYLNYGRILNTVGRQTEAKAAFDKYSAAKPGDKLGAYHKDAIDIVTEDHKWDEPIEVHNVNGVNTATSDFGATLYKDGIVFATSRKTEGHSLIYPWTGTNYLDLYYAERGSAGIDFGNAKPFGGEHINQKYHDGPATFSSDFNTMYFTRVEVTLKGKAKTEYQIEQCKIYRSDFVDNEWSEPVPFFYNSDEYSVSNPWLTPDGNKLYFASDMGGGFGGSDIYVCRMDGSDWGRPINLGPNVNTAGEERFPRVDSVGNLYFSSDGYQGFGGLDICVALNDGGRFQIAKPMKTPFNSSYDDFSISFTEEGKAGYFTSNRYDGGMGDDDIYHFDLNNDQVDSSLVTSIYTIGYRPPMPPIVSLDPRDSTLDATPGNLAVYHGNIYFDFDKSDLRPEAKQALDTLANYMKANPAKTLVISGHCDVRGTADYNQKLSERRNESAIKYLAGKGIPRSRIKATGYGFTKLVNGCTKTTPCTEDQHQMNRRVEYGFE